MARTDPQLNLRLPSELKDKLDEAAKKNMRSLNAETVARLEQSFIEPTENQAKKLIDELQSEALNKGLSFRIEFGNQPSISPHMEGAYRRGYHQAIAEVAYGWENGLITSFKQLENWVEKNGMEWRKDMSFESMIPPPDLW